ncbi:hypothetical protein HS125_08500 [bacterium]|nr:hypothetical protein [bacterium]
MQADGGLVNHGDNPADNVVIRGATAQITRWQSSNALVGLRRYCRIRRCNWSQAPS